MKAMHCLRWPVLLLVALSAWFVAVPAAFADPPLPPRFIELGHTYPGFETADQWGFAVADFDLDGKDDFAFVGRTGQVGVWGLFVVGKDSGGALVFKQQTLIADDGILRALAVPQPAGAAHLLTIGFDGTAREYAGWPLAEVNHFATLASPDSAAAGNIFGDGVPRVAVRSDSQLGVYVVATGAPSWVHPSSGSGDLLLAQLDGDAALEIVLGGSAPGLVLDGATGSIDWQYPDSFGTLLASGALGLNKQTELVGAQYQITVFSGAPFSPLWDFTSGLYFTPTALAVGDLDGDGRAEILYTSPNTGGVQVLDSVTQMSQPLAGANFPAYRLAFADLDGNGKHQILFADGTTVGVADGQSGATLWQADSRTAQFNVAAIGDVDADGKSELLTGYGYNSWFNGAAGLEIRDMDSGDSLAVLTSTGGNANDAFQIAPSRILLAPAEPGAAPQIVLAGTTVYDGRVVVVDGKTHAVNLQLGAYASGPFSSRSISDAALIDMDGDGTKDIVVASQPDLSWVTGAKLQAFTMTGLPIWESVGMGTSTFAINGLFALAPDSGAGDVVVAVLPGGLRAYDRLSHLLNWSFDATNNGAVVVPLGVAGTEIVLENAATMTFYDAATRSYLRQFTLGADVDAIAPLDGRLDRLLVSSGGQLHLIDGSSGSEVATTAYLGDDMAKQNQLAVATLAPGLWRIGVGGPVGIYRYRLELSDRVFSSGFEPPP